MDRALVYAGEIPRSADFLGFEKSVLYALGYLNQAVLGSATCVAGLTCAPTAPPSLQVSVGAGSIYEAETVDATAFAGLGTDSNTIVKQGLLASVASLAITPPSTSGYSQIYLVQAAYNDLDTNALVLNYYNASNPAQPLSGPNNSGTSQYTVRSGVCAVALKAGAAAPTGSQVAPSVDPGYVGLYLITVTNGQSTITSANIAVYPGAPFIPITLPQVPVAIQEQAGNYAVDTGAAANVINITLPATTTLTAGMPIRVKKGNIANTGAMTMIVTAGVTPLSPVSVVWEDGSAFQGADWPANALAEGTYDGTVVRMRGPIGPTIFARGTNGPSSASLVHAGIDTSPTANTIAATVTPAIVSYDTGAEYNIKIANSVTGATVANLSSLGVKNVVRADGTVLQNNDLVVGQEARLVYDGANLQITALAPQTSVLVLPPSGATFYVNGSTGNDSNSGLSPSTAFATVQGAINSISTKYVSVSGVTINIASGTYAGFSVPASNIGSWTIVGNTASPSTVVISSPSNSIAFGRAVNNAYGSNVNLEGLTFSSSLQNVSNLGSCTIYNCVGSAPSTSGYAVFGSYGAAFMRIWGSIGYSGSSHAFVEAGQGAEIQLGYSDAGGNEALSLTITGTPAWGLGFANIQQCASLVAYSSVITLTGAATGPYFNARSFGTIQTFGAGASYFPGSTAGTDDFSQQYS